MKKLLAIFLCVILLIFTFSSCGKENRKDENQQQARVENRQYVYFINPLSQYSDILRDLAKEYEDQTGIEVNIKTVVATEYDKQLSQELKSDYPPTIFYLGDAWAYKTYKEYCADLLTTKAYSDLINQKLAFADGNQIGAIPYSMDAYGIIYNKEITDQYFARKERASDINSMEEITNLKQF